MANLEIANLERAKRHLVILAGGLGSRFGGLKQIEPVSSDGAFILDFSVYDAIKAGFDSIVFISSLANKEDFAEIFTKRYEKFPLIIAEHDGVVVKKNVAVRVVCQTMEKFVPLAFRKFCPLRQKPWGTGHALLSAWEKDIFGKNEELAAINADDYYGSTAFAQIADFFNRETKAKTLLCALIAYRLIETLSSAGKVSRGICRLDSAGKLLNIIEHSNVRIVDGVIYGKNNKGDSLTLARESAVSMNIWALNSAVFPLIKTEFEKFLHQLNFDDARANLEFFLPDVLSNLRKSETLEIHALRTPKSNNIPQWLGMTHRDDLSEVKNKFAELRNLGVYPQRFF